METTSRNLNLYSKPPWDRSWNITLHSMFWENESEKVFNSIVLNRLNLTSIQTIIKSCLTIKSYGLLMIQMLIEWPCIELKKETLLQNQLMELSGFSIQELDSYT